MFRDVLFNYLNNPLTTLLIILVAIILIRIFDKQRSPRSSHAQADYGPPFYTLVIQNKDSSLQEYTQRLQRVFNAVYPQLVNRFALDHHSDTMKTVTLVFSSDLSSPAVTSGTTISLSSDWVLSHQNDVGLLTHELTYIVGQYPSEAPAWFIDGLADYARSLYGPADDNEWSLPDGVQPQDSYTQGSGVAARFLLWLEQHTRLDIVDQLNHALQRGESFSTAFQRFTDQTVDELWSQYQANPAITLTPEQLYKTVISRKPLYYQSSLRVQLASPNTFTWVWTRGLYLSNFAIQADMTIVHGDGGGFIFRSDSNMERNERLRVSPNGTYDLVNQTNTLISGSSPAIKQGHNQTNQLTIVAQKHTIYVYINSEFIGQIDDWNSSYGTVGMMAVDFGNPTDVRYENVQVF